MRTVLPLLLAAFAGVCQAAEVHLLDDFEQGVGQWRLNDGVTAPGGLARYAGIYAVTPGTPGGGR